MRVFGTVPDDYAGPVYYRTAHHNLTRRTVYSRFRFEMDPLGAELRQLDLAGTIRGRAILNPGFIVDESGVLLPKWQTPRKARVVGKRPLRDVQGDGLSGMVSERVHDAIVSLEPRSHLFMPYDAIYEDGRMERFYSHRFADSHLGSDHIRPECLFSLAKHRIETDTNSKGQTYFKQPDFMMLGGTYTNDFFYLNERVVGQRHLFTSDFGAVGRGVTYFSQTLMDKLAPFGDIFPRDVDCVRIGLAPSAPALPPAEAVTERGLLGRIRGIFDRK